MLINTKRKRIMKKLNQGAKANKTGKALEDAVEKHLSSYDITPILYSEWIGSEDVIESRGVLLKNVPYINMFGGNGRGEFVLSADGIYDTRIECRAQYVSGSVDEKFPYLLENAKAFEERNVILVVEGDGYKKGAKSWLKASAAAVKYKNILVLSLPEFKVWCRDNLSSHGDDIIDLQSFIECGKAHEINS
jgi:hypothetical protein